MAKLNGYSYPLTPSGKSSVLSKPPYHFAGEETVFFYNANPEAVASFLPDPLEPSLVNPGGCILHINSYVSECNNENMLSINPERCYYSEAYIQTCCRYKGEEARHFSMFWVNKDFSLIRGWIMGAPKKMGEVCTTFERHHLFKNNPNMKQFGEGYELTGICSSHMERLFKASTTLNKKITPEELPDEWRRKAYNLVHFPDVQLNYKKGAVERLVHQKADVFYGDVWEGKNPKIDFFPSDLDEHMLLKPIEIKSSYYIEFGFTMHGHIIDEVY